MPVTINQDGTLVTDQDRAVARSHTVNDFVAELRDVDPKLAKQIEGVSAVGAQSNWMLIATPLVSYFSARYLANGLDPATQNMIAGVVAAGMTALVGIIWRNFFTVAPVTSVLPRPVDAPPDVPASDPAKQ